MEVTNTGNTCLDDVVVSDTLGNSMDCSPSAQPIAGAPLASAFISWNIHIFCGRARSDISLGKASLRAMTSYCCCTFRDICVRSSIDARVTQALPQT